MNYRNERPLDKRFVDKKIMKQNTPQTVTNNRQQQYHGSGGGSGRSVVVDSGGIVDGDPVTNVWSFPNTNDTTGQQNVHQVSQLPSTGNNKKTIISSNPS